LVFCSLLGGKEPDKCVGLVGCDVQVVWDLHDCKLHTTCKSNGAHVAWCIYIYVYAFAYGSIYIYIYISLSHSTWGSNEILPVSVKFERESSDCVQSNRGIHLIT
jgi:hypothetical protein